MTDYATQRNQGTHLGAHEGPTNIDDGSPTAPSSDAEQVTSGLKLWADIGIKIGGKVDELAKSQNRLAKALQENTPVEYATVASGSYVTGTPLLLNLGSPDQGTYWEVHSVAVGGTNYNVTAAGTSGLYVTAYPNVSTLDMSQLADYASSLPNTAFYGTRQVLVNDQETLCLVVNSGTNGQVYTANAQMAVFSVTASGGRTVTLD